MLEQILKFSSVKAYLEFELVYDNGSETTHLEVGCAEDIENMMQLYLNQKWDELFHDEYDPFSFNYAAFCGITFYGSDEKENKSQLGIHGVHRFGSATLDKETLQDKNADKINRIRGIINE